MKVTYGPQRETVRVLNELQAARMKAEVIMCTRRHIDAFSHELYDDGEEFFVRYQPPIFDVLDAKP